MELTDESTRYWRVQRVNAGSTDSLWPSVAILHSFYRSSIPSGENSTAIQHFEILAHHGVDVSLVSVSTDELLETPGYRLKTAARVATGMGLDPTEILTGISPDVLHIHNLFPNIGTQWLKAFPKPVVATLHNYRAACSSGLLSRNGSPCMDCVVGSSLNGVKHGCYHDSRLATIPIAFRNRKGPDQDAVIMRANTLIVPSAWMSDMYRSLGVEKTHVVHQPTQIPENLSPQCTSPTPNWVFLGRISKEKGILDLVKNWPLNHTLTILGNGPELPLLQRSSLDRKNDIQIRGFVSERERIDIIANATGVLVPSTWREGAPGIYADCMFLGVPLIALKGNTVYDMIIQDGTGSTVERLESTDIETALLNVIENRERYSSKCKEIFSERYSSELWLRNIKKIYTELI